jgi:transcriptional regulator with XRE-family HTH domain
MSKELSQFIQNKMEEQGISLRSIALGAGVSHSYLSGILNGQRSPEIKICNALADYFQVPRIKILQMAGWLDLDEDQEIYEQLREFAAKEPEFRDFFEYLAEIKDPDERKRLLRLIRAGMGK